MRKVDNLTGRRFGKLVIETYEGKGYWWCRCDCGNLVRRSTFRLKQPRAQSRIGERSCGCIEAENKKNGRMSAHQLYQKYKAGAVRRGLNFALIEDRFLQLTSQPCYYCGAPPSQEHRHRKDWGSYVYNGIDRKDNSRGYTIDNCVPCCKVCNSMKGKMDENAFLLQVKRIFLTTSCAKTN